MRRLAQMALALSLLATVVTATFAETTHPVSWWQARAEEAFARLWSATEAPAWLAGRPTVTIRPDDDPNAASRILGGTPDHLEIGISVNLGLIDKAADDSLDALACILAHELAHVVLGHHLQESRDRLRALQQEDVVLELATSREMEIEADALGAKLAASAGYDPGGTVLAFSHLRERLGDNSFWEALGGDHPTYTERLAALDKISAELWQAALDFEVGVDLLRAGNYPCAEQCFRGALETFPKSPEVHCNLGYCLLLQYYRELPGDYWERCDLGQPVPIGYATFLPVEPRRAGLTPEQLAALRRKWEEAVGHLKEALTLQTEYPLAMGNLAYAYLIAPDGPLAAIAKETMAAVPLERHAEDTRWAMANNMALALKLLGQPDKALELLRLAPELVSSDAPAALAKSPTINLALLLAGQGTEAERQQAAGELETALRELPYPSAQWQYTYPRYLSLCRSLGREPRPESKLLAPRPREVSVHFLCREAALYLGTSLQAVVRRLGSPEAVVPFGGKSGPAAAGASAPLASWRYLSDGLELTFFHQSLIRARLTGSSTAVAVVSVDGAETGRLRLGDPVASLDKLLPTFDATVRLGDGRPYRYYSGARLAVLVDAGKIKALALTQGPIS